ncbi:hypothetical protein FGM00_13550 [Aggregatimonas sangjinii]|uniref:DUF5723 domain-containing protein n=1 Tax=Aggregatimonas sangjinii TaxID=2583587 RepID=A0A5B7SWG4_9FLAO|nr:DUF5723 family protein [Aggregatimonas sangjinii]QCX01090.1 hypothetical protein FGM00_13550 [Aggregatimonas sangjinii]
MKGHRFLLYALLGLGLGLQGQNKELLYDFNEIPQSLMVNPGVQSDFQWYVGVPTLSQISFQAGSSGLAVTDLFEDDGIDFNDKVRERAIFGMTPNDELSGNFQVELLHVGFRGKDPDKFYSMGIYTEGDAIGYWFRDYAILGFEGNADRLGQEFDLSHLKTRGELLNVFHFGINQKIDRNLTIGARGKIYSSIFDFSSTKNKGFFVTEEGQNNLLASTLDADLELRTSGIDALRTAEDDGVIGSTVLKRGLFGGNLGLGVDVGFTYSLSEQTVLTGSLLDLGFIYHSNDIKSYSLRGSATVEGIEVILPDALADPDQDFWQNLVDDIETFIPFEENTNNYVTFRPTKLYASIRHDFGEQIPSRVNCECGPNVAGNSFRSKYANSYGGQLYTVFRPRGPQVALSAFYLRRFGNVLAAKATYTVDKFSFTNVGLGLNLQAGPVNLYLLADNLLGYGNIAATNYASFQFGLNIISWGKN